MPCFFFHHLNNVCLQVACLIQGHEIPIVLSCGSPPSLRRHMVSHFDYLYPVCQGDSETLHSCPRITLYCCFVDARFEALCLINYRIKTLQPGCCSCTVESLAMKASWESQNYVRFTLSTKATMQ